MMTPADFWWNEVTGPKAFVRAVAESVLDGRMTVPLVPADLPWRRAMRGAVLESLRESFADGEPYIEPVDAADECPGSEEIGEFLLGRLARPEVADVYRPQPGRAVQSYIVSNGVMDGRVVWVKGVPEGDLPKWLAFAKGFGKPSLKTGLMIIESRYPLPAGQWDDLRVVEFSRLVGWRDTQAFASIALSNDGKDVSPAWRNYMASVAAHLCGANAELATALFGIGDWKARDPRELLAGLPDAPEQGAALGRKLWAAQIETLFPIIETRRVDIIDSIRERLEEALRKKPGSGFAKPLADPDELELGEIAYLMTARDANGLRQLYVPDAALREEVRLLRDCRNLLAHRHGCCSPRQVDFILGLEG